MTCTHRTWGANGIELEMIVGPAQVIWLDHAAGLVGIEPQEGVQEGVITWTDRQGTVVKVGGDVSNEMYGLLDVHAGSSCCGGLGG